MSISFSNRASLVKKGGSQQDVRKVNDVTARLTDPKQFPAANKFRQEERNREKALSKSSSKSIGSLKSVNWSKQALSSVPNENMGSKQSSKVNVSSNPNLNDSVFSRLYSSKTNINAGKEPKFDGYPVGFKVPDEKAKEKLRKNAQGFQIFGFEEPTEEEIKPLKVEDKSRVSKTIFEDLAFPPVSKSLSTPEPLEKERSVRKVPVYDQ